MMKSNRLVIGRSASMTFVALILCVLLLSSGCANHPTFEFRGCGPIAIPEINCKPYPKPAKVDPVPPGTPNFFDHGVELGHDEFLWVGKANRDIITHMKGTRAVGTYFCDVHCAAQCAGARAAGRSRRGSAGRPNPTGRAPSLSHLRLGEPCLRGQRDPRRARDFGGIRRQGLDRPVCAGARGCPQGNARWVAIGLV